MTQSVRSPNSDLVTLAVLIDGAEIPDAHSVLSMRTDHGVDAIPTATITLADGDPAAEDFPASASATFDPGKRIELRAGYHGHNRTIFTGLILRHRIGLDAEGSSSLTLTCFDPALKTMLTRSAASLSDKTDAEAMTSLIKAAGLTPAVAATGPIRPSHIQGDATDWEFLLRLARANGHVLRVADGTVQSAPPRFDTPDLNVEYGDTVIAADLDLDATAQWPAASASAWDAVTRSVLTGAASEPSVNAQGNQSGQHLSAALGLPDRDLATAYQTDAATLKTRADASLLRTRLARITGTLTCPGNAGLAHDSLLEVTGFGEKFNGNAYVSAVSHIIAEGTWRSTVTIGLPPAPVPPPAPGHQPGLQGLQIARVLQTHEDPAGQGRIKVTLPLVADTAAGLWVRLANPYATNGAGLAFLPEVDDEVVLGFLDGSPDSGIVLGALNSPAWPRADTPDADNSLKSIVTREGLRLSFDDAQKIIALQTPGGHRITLDDDGKTLTIADLNDNTLTMTQSGMTLHAPHDISLSAGGRVSITGAQGVAFSSDNDVSIEGMTITAQADTELTARGNASAEISSDGQTIVKGPLTRIN